MFTLSDRGHPDATLYLRSTSPEDSFHSFAFILHIVISDLSSRDHAATQTDQHVEKEQRGCHGACRSSEKKSLTSVGSFFVTRPVFHSPSHPDTGTSI